MDTKEIQIIVRPWSGWFYKWQAYPVNKIGDELQDGHGRYWARTAAGAERKVRDWIARGCPRDKMTQAD